MDVFFAIKSLYLYNQCAKRVIGRDENVSENLE